jgi:Arc/MetJ-type ribon-helix-helix transcriptional regulator
MKKIRKTVTLPLNVTEWAEEAVKRGDYAGVRSFSGLIEYLLRIEMKRKNKENR